jgi:hypothetical protein
VYELNEDSAQFHEGLPQVSGVISKQLAGRRCSTRCITDILNARSSRRVVNQILKKIIGTSGVKEQRTFYMVIAMISAKRIKNILLIFFKNCRQTLNKKSKYDDHKLDLIL